MEIIQTKHHCLWRLLESWLFRLSEHNRQYTSQNSDKISRECNKDFSSSNENSGIHKRCLWSCESGHFPFVPSFSPFHWIALQIALWKGKEDQRVNENDGNEGLAVLFLMVHYIFHYYARYFSSAFNYI